MTEDAITVDDLDGDAVTGLEVLSELDLGKATLPQRFPHLVLPHPSSSPRCRHAPSSLSLSLLVGLNLFMRTTTKLL